MKQYEWNTGGCISRNPRERRVENDTFNASELNSWNLSRRSGGQPKNRKPFCFLTHASDCSALDFFKKTKKGGLTVGLEHTKDCSIFSNRSFLRTKSPPKMFAPRWNHCKRLKPLQYLCQALCGAVKLLVDDHCKVTPFPKPVTKTWNMHISLHVGAMATLFPNKSRNCHLD